MLRLPFDQADAVVVMDAIQAYARGERKYEDLVTAHPALALPYDGGNLVATTDPKTDIRTNYRLRAAYAMARDVQHQKATRGALLKHSLQSAILRACDSGDVLTFIEPS